MVPKAEFRSYYGRPIIKEPVWEVPDVPGYLFFGGLAGASSVLAAGAQLTGRPGLTRAAKLAALGGISISTVFLIHDLGRPARFHHMLRVFKLSSPMSVGSWILSAYGPMAGAAAVTNLAGLLPSGGKSTRSADLRGQDRRHRARPSGHRRGRPARARGRHLHRGPAVRHFRTGLARGTPRAALRVRGLGRQRGRRLRAAGRPAGGAGARPPAGHYRFRRRTCRQDSCSNGGWGTWPSRT